MRSGSSRVVSSYHRVANEMKASVSHGFAVAGVGSVT